MKNQYVGDIGDYGKYGLLRFLSQKGIRIGVNWYLTENDESSDGKFTGYLEKPKNRSFDPELFDILKAICSCKDKTVQMVEESGVLKNTVFYDNLLMSRNDEPSIRERVRQMWFGDSILMLEYAELIFADPDNGITYSKNPKTKDSEKYIFPEEIRRYYDLGKNVAFYCHKGRRRTEEWEHAKENIRSYVRDAKILAVTCHKGTQRSYIFVLHPDCYLRYAKLLEDIWIHKFFHMMYPDLFSEFHSEDWKTHFLCAMQILPRESFYGKAGQIAEIRRHMSLKDYYRIANVVYAFFPEISKGGICRLSLSRQGQDSVQTWKPGQNTYILPADYNDKLLDIKWFTNASEKDGNNLFVVMNDADELCGVFSRLEGEPADKQSFKMGRKAIWHRCFQEHNRLPKPEDGKTIKDRTIKDPRNLIYIYSHYYSYFDVDNELEKVFESHRKQFENEDVQFDSARININEKYPLKFTPLKELKIEQLIYGYKGSLLTMLYDDFTNFDIIRTQEIQDIGYIYSDGERRWYDSSQFGSENEAFERLLQEVVLLLCLYAGPEGSDDQILKSPLSKNLKVKLLSIYYPEKYIGIYDIDELDYILGMLDIPFSNKESWVQKNHLIIDWKNSHLPFAKENVSNFVFLKTICAWLEIPFSQGKTIRDALKISLSDLTEKKPVHEKSIVVTQPTGDSTLRKELPPTESESVLQKDRAQAEKASEKEADDIGHMKQKSLPPADSGVIKQNEIEEAIEQLTIANEAAAEDFDFTYAGIPQDKKEHGGAITRNVIPRDIQKKKNALAHAGYKCEYNEKHQSFLSRATGLPYMEAHHLIPMEYYDSFDVSIDIEENIVSLCPNCHREIHHGKDASFIVKKLYEQRKPYLQKAGIDISLNQLLVWYNCKHEPV